MHDKFWFNYKRDERMERVAKLLSQDDEAMIRKMVKLKMAGIRIADYNKVVELSNGAVIMDFDYDGLVDRDEDWRPIEASKNRVYRIYGIGTELESINYRHCTRYAYGLFELLRNHSLLESEPLIDTGFHECLVVDIDGNIVLNTVDMYKELKEKGFQVQDRYFYELSLESMAYARKSILDHVIKHGPEKSMIGYGSIQMYGDEAYAEDADGDLTYITCLNNRNNTYQLMRMGFCESTSFVLFDLKTEEAVLVGNDVITVNTKYGIGLPADGYVYLFSPERDGIIKYKTNTSFMNRIRSEKLDRVEYNDMLRKQCTDISELRIKINRLRRR